LKIYLTMFFEIQNRNMAKISNTSSINSIDISIQKSSGKPKSIVWGTHIKQGNQISKGHWSATCNYCNEYWYKGSPAALENHLGNLCNKAPPDLTPDRVKDINRALVKAFIVCRVPFHIIENPFFLELLKTLRPAYEPPSRDVLSGRYLAQETAFVNQAMIKQLNESKNLTITCDGWSNPSNESIWNFVIYTPAHYQYLWSLQNLSNERHTQELLAEEITNILEKIDCSLADCFIGLAHLGAAIRRLPENDYCNFCQQAIAIYNRRFAEFDDNIYILCFFLYPGYTVWAQGTFRCILLAADNFYEKMDKKQKERKMLMSQMRSYRHHTAPFDVSFDNNESPTMWWTSLEDNFLKNKDHICQLANKLFSVTPHATGCERIWSTLGWYYGKCRTRLSLGKIENMQKLSVFYLANSKKELPYFFANNKEQDMEFPEEKALNIEELLNLDVADFTNNLGEIVFDTSFEFSEEENN
ncbi:21676_t:CDS:2, partial [Gigaspora margarita]